MNDVNEGRKESMPDEKRLREATIKHLSFGVGTRMITGGDQAALGGVYKLVAIDDEPRIKVSETAAKTINPGIKRVFRVTDQDGWFLADVLALRDEQPPSPGDWIYHPSDPHARYRLDEGITAVDLLETLMEKGRPSIQIDPFSIEEGRNRLEEQFRHLHPTYQRLLNPHVYKVSLTERLKALKDRMIREFSGKVGLP